MTDTALLPFMLNPNLDASALARDYARLGHVSIDPFITPDCAEALRQHLLARRDWVRVINAGERVFEMPRSAVDVLTPEQRTTLDRKIAEAALHSFQYRYESIRVDDDPTMRGSALLDRFADFMSSSMVVDFFKVVTAAPIDFADAQATIYWPGDFLTRHDDDVSGKRRVVAYVLGMTPEWRAEWGGLLLFHGARHDIAHGFAPTFNALRLFAVPADHSVSHVWPYAPHPRLSVTGWLRTHAASEA